MVVNTDPDLNYEDRLRSSIRNTPIEHFTYSINTASPPIIQQSDSTDFQVVTTTGTWTSDTVTWPDPEQPQAGPWYAGARNIPESPFNEGFARRLIERFGTDRQDVVLPEGVEMLKECQIEGSEGKDVKLEFRIKGPTIPKELIEKIPPEMFLILDYEIKRAMIRSFNLVPAEGERKRLLIIEEDE